MDVEVAAADGYSVGADAVGPRGSRITVPGSARSSARTWSIPSRGARCSSITPSQSVIGVEDAEIVEVLGRHDSGSSETRMLVRAPPTKGQYNHPVLLEEESGKEVE